MTVAFDFIKFNYDLICDQMDLKPASIKQFKERERIIVSLLERVDVNEDTMLNVKKYLAQTGKSIATQYKYFMDVKSVLKIVYKLKVLEHPIHEGVSAPKVPYGHCKTGILGHEVRRIMNFVHKTPDPKLKAMRHMIVCLLFYQGFRGNSVIQIKVSDINFQEGYVSIKEKQHDGYKKYLLNPATLEAIQEYLAIYKIKTGLLLPGRKGGISTYSIKVILKNLLIEAGVDKGVHGFRHAFITEATQVIGIEGAAGIAGITLPTAAKYYDAYNEEASARIVQKAMKELYERD